MLNTDISKDNNGLRIDCSTGPRTGWRSFDPSGPTKVEGGTSRFCPHCLKDGIKRRRKREYRKSTPLSEVESGPEQDYPTRQPRIMAKNHWWNIYLAEWLVNPGSSLPWFRCWENAECPACGPGRVRENDYRRQFGRLRLAALILERKVSLSELITWHIKQALSSES